MNQIDKLTAGGEAWESGKFGRDEQFVQKAEPKQEPTLDDALGLQLISIRLEKQLIEELKFIAKANGVGYQPLMRDVLHRFVEVIHSSGNDGGNR